jgi:L-rhamnose mutarotase
MLALMQRDGVHNFSIYRYGLLLFACQERDTPPPEGKVDSTAKRNASSKPDFDVPAKL